MSDASDRPAADAAPLIAPGETWRSVTEQIGGIPLSKTSRGWLFGFAVAFAGLMLFFLSVAWLLLRGVGIWGIQIPVAWGFAIINFVWWIGIGHAGTFISAFLLLMAHEWRSSINRFAEAMTLFAVACAGLFPLLHLGRPWVFYWMLPYPDTMGLWPQFRSTLVWDVFAVGTYLLVSLLFFYLGLLPDLATMRDLAKKRWKKRLYGLFALGWRNSAVHWQRQQKLYLLLAGLATPLVVSVHSVVSFDFAITILPGWHSTIFPPYFVAGALFSGFAMVLNIILPVRKVYGLENLITRRHLNALGCVMLTVGTIVAYSYFTEALIAWYSGHSFEIYMMRNRMLGNFAPAYWFLILCNVVVPQALWSRRVRTHAGWLFLVAAFINIGMWLERFVIIIQSLHRDFLPSSWGSFGPTFWDWATLAGSLGLFFALLFLFIRFLPMISISEVKELAGKEGGREN